MVADIPVALISGISGQDGSYMAEYLIQKGYKVFGITRDKNFSNLVNIRHLSGNITLIESSYETSDLIEILRFVKPIEIYNFAGQSFVSKSWSMLEETVLSQATLVGRFLDAVLNVDIKIRFLNASSSEIFGESTGGILNEASVLTPYNPYGCAKAFGYNLVNAYRDRKGLFAVNAILFPHESPRRNENFAFKKIISSAVAIKKGLKKELKLGSLDVMRDWGYAPSFVHGMHLLIKNNNPENVCFCTGESRSVKDVVKITFELLNIDWTKHVIVEKGLVRAYEPFNIVGNPCLAKEKLGWRVGPSFEDLIETVINFELKKFEGMELVFQDEKPKFIY